MTKIVAHIMKILHKQNPHINRSALLFLSKELTIAGEEIYKLSTDNYNTVTVSNINNIEELLFNDKLNNITTKGDMFFNVILDIIENNKTIITTDAIMVLSQLLEKITIVLLTTDKTITKTEIEQKEEELFGKKIYRHTYQVHNGFFFKRRVYKSNNINTTPNLLNIHKDRTYDLIKDPIPII